MEYTNYEEALSFWKEDNEKIKVIVFAIKDCPTCDDFLPDLFDVEINNRIDHFDVKYVDLETSTMDFPPISTPTAYFHIPNTDQPMPIFRVGGTIPSILQNDLDAMISIKDDGLTFEEAFFSKPQTEMTSWVQRLARF